MRKRRYPSGQLNAIESLQLRDEFFILLRDLERQILAQQGKGVFSPGTIIWGTGPNKTKAVTVIVSFKDGTTAQYKVEIIYQGRSLLIGRATPLDGSAEPLELSARLFWEIGSAKPSEK